MWWWGVFLPQIPANPKVWGEDHRWFGTITGSAPTKTNGEKDVPFMAISHEALAATMFECYRDSWVNKWALKEKYPDRKIAMAKSGKDSRPPVANNNEVAGQGNVVAGEGWVVRKDGTIVCFGGNFKGKWVQADCGAARDGGWAGEGLVKYNEYSDMIGQARVKETTAAVEKQVLDLVRQKHGIVEVDARAHKAAKRRKLREFNEEKEEEDDAKAQLNDQIYGDLPETDDEHFS